MNEGDLIFLGNAKRRNRTLGLAEPVIHAFDYGARGLSLTAWTQPLICWSLLSEMDKDMVQRLRAACSF